MSASARIEVVGVKNTINQLGKIDKELQKEFKASATRVAQPAISAAQNMYTKVPLSGMSRNWKSHKRTPPQNIKGFDVSRAKAGVQMKFDTRRNAIGVILVIQKDQAAAIFETAGRANANRLSNNLDPVRAGRTRLIGPAVYSARRGIEKELKHVIADASRTVQRGL